jgi:DNA end-binding protein Ku
MAPRAYWKGYLRLSLVTCPIELFPATSQSEKTHFHQINTQTGHRLRQQMVDEETGKVVDKEHKGRGYELSKGRYVEIDEDELQAIEMESTHTVDIDSFVRSRRSTNATSTSPITSCRTARWPPKPLSSFGMP